jgi:hypothetical protein
MCRQFVLCVSAYTNLIIIVHWNTSLSAYMNFTFDRCALEHYTERVHESHFCVLM